MSIELPSTEPTAIDAFAKAHCMTDAQLTELRGYCGQYSIDIDVIKTLFINPPIVRIGELGCAHCIMVMCSPMTGKWSVALCDGEGNIDSLLNDNF